MLAGRTKIASTLQPSRLHERPIKQRITWSRQTLLVSRMVIKKATMIRKESYYNQHLRARTLTVQPRVRYLSISLQPICPQRPRSAIQTTKMRKKKSKKIMRWGTRLRVLCMVCFNPQSTFKQTQTWITVSLVEGPGALTSQIRLFDNTMRKKILRFMTKRAFQTATTSTRDTHKHNTKLATTLYVPKVIQIPTLPYAPNPKKSPPS